MSRVGILAFAILGIGLILLVAFNARGDVFGIESNQFARLLTAGTFALVIGAGLVARRAPLGGAVRSLAIWVAIVLALVAGYQYRFELQDVASRVTAGLVPGSPISRRDAQGRDTVMIEKGSDGHFEVRATVQGKTIGLLVDTGASTSVLTTADARRAGFNVDALTFSIPVSTANGVAQAAPVIASEIAIGSIVRERQQILVAQDGMLGQSLLGMNFISSLDGFQIQGDRMILTD